MGLVVPWALLLSLPTPLAFITYLDSRQVTQSFSIGPAILHSHGWMFGHSQARAHDGHFLRPISQFPNFANFLSLDEGSTSTISVLLGNSVDPGDASNGAAS